jgi:hypothetical protein
MLESFVVAGPLADPLAGEEEKGTAFVREMRIKERVIRHQPSLRML